MLAASKRKSFASLDDAGKIGYRISEMAKASYLNGTPMSMECVMTVERRGQDKEQIGYSVWVGPEGSPITRNAELIKILQRVSRLYFPKTQQFDFDGYKGLYGDLLKAIGENAV